MNIKFSIQYFLLLVPIPLMGQVYLSYPSKHITLNLTQPCIGHIEINGSTNTQANVKLSKQLELISKFPSIKGVILVIRSGGGSATAAWEIAHNLEKAREKFPIIAFVSEMAASGGYLAAAACNKIVTTPMSEIGSIGVVITHESVEPEKFKKDGMEGKIKITKFKRGKFKQLGDKFTPLSPEGQEMLDRELDYNYEQFCAYIARNRAIPIDSVKAQEALLFPGVIAREKGLIDHIGTYQDAIGILVQEMRLKGTPVDGVDFTQNIIQF